ncbi:hypothetical protein PAPYR_3984 [Paratrimastix pyriformis]|uniref:Uncharacterized protein n=1 Tax=Paratrimastix pyriformis TaxID=342808 RepID=A0ABQ8UQU3_9EUKA|nr:hypothetical protein PAPYR_3984 [Paratrimastix pyriformis]
MAMRASSNLIGCRNADSTRAIFTRAFLLLKEFVRNTGVLKQAVETNNWLEAERICQEVSQAASNRACRHSIQASSVAPSLAVMCRTDAVVSSPKHFTALLQTISALASTTHNRRVLLCCTGLPMRICEALTGPLPLARAALSCAGNLCVTNSEWPVAFLEAGVTSALVRAAEAPHLRRTAAILGICSVANNIGIAQDVSELLQLAVPMARHLVDSLTHPRADYPFLPAEQPLLFAVRILSLLVQLSRQNRPQDVFVPVIAGILHTIETSSPLAPDLCALLRQLAIHPACLAEMARAGVAEWFAGYLRSPDLLLASPQTRRSAASTATMLCHVSRAVRWQLVLLGAWEATAVWPDPDITSGAVGLPFALPLEQLGEVLAEEE